MTTTMDGWPEGPRPGWPELAAETAEAMGPPTPAKPRVPPSVAAGRVVSVSENPSVMGWDWESFAQLVVLRCSAENDRGQTCGERVGYVVDRWHGDVDAGRKRVAVVSERVEGRVGAVRAEVEAGKADWDDLAATARRAQALVAELEDLVGATVEPRPRRWYDFDHGGLLEDGDRWETRLYPIDAGTRPVPVWCPECGHPAEVPVGKLRAKADQGAQRVDKGKRPEVLRF